MPLHQPRRPERNTMLSPLEIGLLKAALVDIAAARGITLKQAVREALEAYLADHPRRGGAIARKRTPKRSTQSGRGTGQGLEEAPAR